MSISFHTGEFKTAEMHFPDAIAVIIIDYCSALLICRQVSASSAEDRHPSASE
jgi:hypothetical protein